MSRRERGAPKIHFGVMLQGAGVNMNAWRHPSVRVDASSNFNFYCDRALKAEAAGMDFVFVADGLHIHEKSFPHFLNRFEPVALLSALAAATSGIGLVGTVSTSYSDPFTVARQIGSIDALSGGRAGWNAVTSPLKGSGRNYGRAHPEHALRYQMAEDYIDAISKLWDSWEDDAFIRDPVSGRYFDPSKMHRANHQGDFFSVEGPLSIGRSPQGQPVIFQAGASADGIELAGKWADAVFTNGGSFEQAQRFYRQVKDSARAHGRNPDDIKVFPGIGPIVGATAQEAEQKCRELRDLLSVEDALNYLSHFFNQHDFSLYPLDAPFPDLADLGKDGFRSTTEEIKRIARDRGQTLREVAFETAILRAHIGTSQGFIGAAGDIADELIRWREEGAADGFMLGFPVLGFGLDDFVAHVLPILEDRGYHQQQPQSQPQSWGGTLRDRLHLPFRRSRYAGSAGADVTAAKANVSVKVVRPDSANARWCVQQYFQELSTRFDTGFDPASSNPAEDDDLISPTGCFVLAELNGRPVGCGALKGKGPDVAEIKRMWTDPDLRRQGLARKILHKLEAVASELGYGTLQLETNRSLAEAQALYRGLGYAEVEAFNAEPYAHFWFEKHL